MLAFLLSYSFFLSFTLLSPFFVAILLAGFLITFTGSSYLIELCQLFYSVQKTGDRSSLLHSGVSDDDGAPNTYDDNDSFLDDAIMGSDQETGKDKDKGSDDSDWSPGADEKGATAKVH